MGLKYFGILNKNHYINTLHSTAYISVRTRRIDMVESASESNNAKLYFTRKIISIRPVETSERMQKLYNFKLFENFLDEIFCVFL